MKILSIQMKLARAQLGLFVLVAILQRAPVIKYAFQFEKALSAPIAKLVKAVAISAAAFNEVHAQTGATDEFVVEPASPAEAVVGVEFNMAFFIRGTQEEERSWGIAGDIPPGLNVGGLVDGTVNLNFPGDPVLISGTPTTPGSYTFTAKPWDLPNQTGDTTTATSITINVTEPPTPPEILNHPSPTRVPTGGRAQFFVEWKEGVVFGIQWLKDGVELDGETGQTLILTDVAEGDEGVYSVRLTNDAGSTTSSGASLTIDDVASSALVNLATRGFVGTGADIMIGGLTVLGGTSKTVLVRGLGPQLEASGVPGFLEDPLLTVFRTIFGNGPPTSQLLITNDNWEGGPNAAELAEALTTLNKPLVAGSKDAALLLTLNEGVYTFQLSGNGNTEGVGLIELFVVE